MATRDHAIHDVEEEAFDYNSAFPALPMATPQSSATPVSNNWAGTNKFSVKTSNCTQVSFITLIGAPHCRP